MAEPPTTLSICTSVQRSEQSTLDLQDSCGEQEKESLICGSIGPTVADESEYGGDDGKNNTFQGQHEVVKETIHAVPENRKKTPNDVAVVRNKCRKLQTGFGAWREKLSLSTINRAAEERAKQGTHQLEISFGGELDLHKHYNSCPKNPGHHDFVPVCSLHRWRLPRRLWINPDSILAFCRYAAQLTVKLELGYVSPQRAELKGIPLSDLAGQRVMTTGSGCVTGIKLCLDTCTFPCPFQNCEEISGSHDVFGYITVTTAAHVVVDSAEALETTVVFFEDSPADKQRVGKARGVKVETVSVEGDFCELLCVTHSRNLYAKLSQLLSCPPKQERNMAGWQDFFFEEMPSATYWEKMRRSLMEWIPALFDIEMRVNSDNKDEILFWLRSILNKLITDFDICDRLVSETNVQSDAFQIDFIRMTLQRLLGVKYINDSVRKQLFQNVLREFHEYLNLFESANIIACCKKLSGLWKSLKRLTEIQEYDLSGWCQQTIPTSFIKEIIHTGVTVLCFYLLIICCMDDLEFNWCEMFENIYRINDLFTILLLEHNKQNPMMSNSEMSNLVIHISHPHGQSKQISFGTHFTCDTSSGHYKHIYTAPTCHGGSGGPVWILLVGQEGKITYSTIYGVLHGGCYDNINRLNHSCSWTFYPPQKRQ